LANLPSDIHTAFITAYAESLQTVFRDAIPLALFAFALTWLLKEVPLRKTVETQRMDESFAMPNDPTSLEVIERSLSALGSRENRHRIYQRLATQAGVNLSHGGCWLLARIADHQSVTVDALSQQLHVDPRHLEPLLQELEQKGFVSLSEASGGGEPLLELSATGNEALARIVQARRDTLENALSGWTPEQNKELAEMLNRLAQDLVMHAPAA
jgi:DNA-binding MarR family transcriptional regulator